MAVGIVDRQKLVNIADAVRAKKGITGNMTLDAIASNITSIPTAENNAKFDFASSGSNSSGDLLSYLTTVDLSNFDTSNYTNMFQLFFNFRGLKNLDVSGLNTSKVTNMGYVFSGCWGLTSLDLSNFDTSRVSNMSDMFSNCPSLKSLDLSNFDTRNVTNISYMFAQCSSLTTVDLSNWDTSKVNSMYFMFNECKSLTSLDLSNFDTSNVTDLMYLFRNCSSLTSLDLSNWDTSKVNSMSDMFLNCSKLSNLTLGTDWASNSSISSFDLSSCPLAHESAVDVINKLATRDNSPVITFSNQVGLYQSEIDVATNKGWSVSGCVVLVEDPTTATVGQYALIDGVMSKCVYVADAPQAWGQRIFASQSNFTDSNGVYRFQWGGYGTETGIRNYEIGNGLSNTNALIAMNLQSTDGTPTVWDAITEFRSTHSDRWFVPCRDEVALLKEGGWSADGENKWSSSEYVNGSNNLVCVSVYDSPYYRGADKKSLCYLKPFTYV